MCVCSLFHSLFARLSVASSKRNPKNNFKQQHRKILTKNNAKKNNMKNREPLRNIYIRICTYAYMHAHVHNRHVWAVCVRVYLNLPLKWKFKQKHLSTLNKLLTTATTHWSKWCSMIDATNRSRWGRARALHLTSLHMENKILRLCTMDFRSG